MYWQHAGNLYQNAEISILAIPRKDQKFMPFVQSQFFLVIKMNINTNNQAYLCILCYSIACFQKRDFLNIWFLELAFLEKHR